SITLTGCVYLIRLKGQTFLQVGNRNNPADTMCKCSSHATCSAKNVYNNNSLIGDCVEMHEVWTKRYVYCFHLAAARRIGFAISAQVEGGSGVAKQRSFTPVLTCTRCASRCKLCKSAIVHGV